MAKRTIYIKKLDNPIGRFIIGHYEWTIIPIFFLSIFILPYIFDRPRNVSKGIIVRTYFKNIEQYHRGKLNTRYYDYKALFIVLDDSTRYVLKSKYDIDSLNTINYLNQYATITYHWEERNETHRFFFQLADNDRQIYKNHSKRDSKDNFYCIDKLVLNNKITIDFNPKNWYIISAFVLFSFWFLCGFINYVARIWNIDTKEKKAKISYSNQLSENKNGRPIMNFDKCPACGFRLKDSDTICPDCGLNFN